MKRGFTLIEVIIAVGISLAVLAFVLANFNRGGDDSALNRETSLLMARVRFAQEESNSGKSFSYCYHYTGNICTGNGPFVCQDNPLEACRPSPNSCMSGPCIAVPARLVCNTDPLQTCKNFGDACGPGGTGVCRNPCDPLGTFTTQGFNCCPGGTSSVLGGVCPVGNETPEGGFAVSFACPIWAEPKIVGPLPSGVDYSNVKFAFMSNGATTYGLFAERRDCGSTADIALNTRCFPPHNKAFDDNKIGSDGIVSSLDHAFAAGATGLKGDTLQDLYVLDPKVVVKDLRITAQGDIAGVNKFTCSTGSPWRGKTVSTAGDSFVPLTYPLQVAIRFIPPDGRNVMLTDNIAITPPPSSGSVPDPNNAWVSAEVMLGLVKRPNSDCRVVTMTRTGVVSQRTDANCIFD